MPDSETEDARCKVGRLADAHDLDAANAELADRWLGADGDGESVRSLTDWFNRQVLSRELRDAGADPVEGSVENLYELLTDDDTLEAVRMQARANLEEHGLDPDAVEDRFVSHQSVYRHLKNCLDAEKEARTLSKTKERDRITSMQNRAEAVVVDSITRLRDGDELDLGEFEVLVPVRVSCEACGSLHDVTALIDDGGCPCQR